jgi:hypothetical protein
VRKSIACLAFPELLDTCWTPVGNHWTLLETAAYLPTLLDMLDTRDTYQAAARVVNVFLIPWVILGCRSIGIVTCNILIDYFYFYQLMDCSSDLSNAGLDPSSK